VACLTHASRTRKFLSGN